MLELPSTWPSHLSKYLILVALGILLFATFKNSSNKPVKTGTVSINEYIFAIEIADTDVLRIKGLSNRPFLNETSGMLFVFDTPGLYSFWMKDMQFNLDFIWILDNKVVDLTKNVSNPASIKPCCNIDKVLEVNSGVVNKYNIKVGDAVSTSN